jgi:hypothetical protein
VRAAWRERQDPRLAEYIVKLAQLDPMSQTYIDGKKAGKPVYEGLLSALRPWTLRRAVRTHYTANGGSLSFGKINRNKLRESIRELHQEQWALIEQHPELLTDRLRLHEVIMELWESHEPYAREALLNVLRYVPFKWGPWKAIRHILKASLRARDWEVFGILTARVELESTAGQESRQTPAKPFNVAWGKMSRDVSKATLSYLQRYCWRALRLIARSQPSLYPEVAAQVLKAYPNVQSYQLTSSWVYNHLLFHNAKGYARNKRSYSAERFYHYPSDYYQHRAFPELWSARAEPLLGLLESAHNSGVLTFTTTSLLKDFRERLKGLDASWVARVASHKKTALDDFLATWFSELCPHPQADYESQGLHRPLLALLWSSSRAMQTFAMSYFKAHLSVLTSLVTSTQVMGFVQSDNKELQELGKMLLDPDNPHVTLTFEEWTTLLERRNSYGFAAMCFKLLFSAKDMSFEWFARMLTSELDQASSFAMSLLKDPRFRPEGGDLLSFYWELLSPASWRAKTAKLAFEGLEGEVDSDTDQEGTRLLNQLSSARLWALLLHPDDLGREALGRWVKKGWLHPNLLGVEQLKLTLDEARWGERWWLEALEAEGGAWRDRASYQGNAASLAQGWLLTSKLFKVEDLTPEWLFSRALSGSWSDRPFKEYMLKHLEWKHFASLSEGSSRRPTAQEGVEAIISALMGADWSTRRTLTELLKSRHRGTLLKNNPNTKLPPAKRLLSDELLSFELFERLVTHSDEEVRDLGLYFARFELARWTREAPLTFARLLPFFMKGAEEVRTALLKAMTSPSDADERIDVRLEQFDANELYAFCFSPRAQVRDLGLSLIASYPDRFMDPTKLAILAESSDRRVCEGVVKALYASLRFKEVSAPWQPTAESVAPRSEVAKKQAEIVLEQPPKGIKPADRKNKRYLGVGSSVPQGVDPSAAVWMSDFLRRTVFRLSPGHPFKEDLGRLTPTTSAWRNKVSLIKALRDLATQEADFAALITPILQELMSSRGRAERDACLVALARIRHAHPSLSTPTSTLA